MKLSKEMWGDKYQIIVAAHFDKGHLHNGRGNAENGTGIYAAYQTSNRLNTGVAGENIAPADTYLFLSLSGLTRVL